MTEQEQLVQTISEHLGKEKEDQVMEALGMKPRSDPHLARLKLATTLKEYQAVLDRCPEKSEAKKQAIEKIENLLFEKLKSVTTLEDCWKIYGNAPTKYEKTQSNLIKQIFAKVQTLYFEKLKSATTVEECDNVYLNTKNSELKKQALQKKENLLSEKFKSATTLEDFLYIAKCDPDKTTARWLNNENPLFLALSLAKTIEDLKLVYEQAYHNTEIQIQASERIEKLLFDKLKLAETLRDCWDIASVGNHFCRNGKNDNIATQALKKGLSFVKTLSENSIFLTSHPAVLNKEIQNLALEQALYLQNISSTTIGDTRLSESGTREQILKKLEEALSEKVKSATTFKECWDIYRDSPGGLDWLALEKALSFAVTIEECMKVYYASRGSELAVNKALSLAKTVEECFNIECDAYADSGDYFGNEAMDRALSIAKTLSDYHIIYSYARRHFWYDNNKKCRIIEKALILTKTIEECRGLFEKTESYSDEAYACIRRMAEIIKNS